MAFYPYPGHEGDKQTGRDSDKFMLRLPTGMRDRIRRAAEANNRSMNAEIVATLDEKYPNLAMSPETFASTLGWAAHYAAEAASDDERRSRLELMNGWLSAYSKHSGDKVRFEMTLDEESELRLSISAQTYSSPTSGVEEGNKE